MLLCDDTPSPYLGGFGPLPLILCGEVTYTSVTPPTGSEEALPQARAQRRPPAGTWVLAPPPGGPRLRSPEAQSSGDSGARPAAATPPAGGAGGIFKSPLAGRGRRGGCWAVDKRPESRACEVFALLRLPARGSLRALRRLPTGGSTALASASPARRLGARQLLREPAGNSHPSRAPLAPEGAASGHGALPRRARRRAGDERGAAAGPRAHRGGRSAVRPGTLGRPRGVRGEGGGRAERARGR